MRLHNGQRPYSCDRCNLSFTQFVHLKLHSRIHNNERPFTCSQCGRNYISLSGLRTHWKNTGCNSSSSVKNEITALQAYVNNLSTVRTNNDKNKNNNKIDENHLPENDNIIITKIYNSIINNTTNNNLSKNIINDDVKNSKNEGDQKLYIESSLIKKAKINN